MSGGGGGSTSITLLSFVPRRAAVLFAQLRRWTDGCRHHAPRRNKITHLLDVHAQEALLEEGENRERDAEKRGPAGKEECVPHP